jgi:cytochrome c5
VQNTDAVFLKHFTQIIAGLFAIMVVLIVVAWIIYDRQGFHDANPAKEAEVSRRLAPVGGVYAGDTGRAAMVAAQEAARAAMAAKVAFEGALDGELIYNNVCSACHQTGAGGAPLPTREAWAPRIAQGLDTLVKHAVEGYQGNAGVMPAKGGRLDLTDEQVKVTVEYLVKKYQ